MYLNTSIIENSLQVGGLALELILGLVILALLILLIRERYRGERVERNSMRPVQPQKPAQAQVMLGIDRALAQLFYRDLRKALEEGKIRPALVSDECPGGTVAFDFARQDWVCVEKDGATHPLGAEPAGEQLELEDLEGISDE